MIQEAAALASLAEAGFVSTDVAEAAMSIGKTAWVFDLAIPLPIKKSSCIATATYTLRSGTLALTFHNGSQAEYAGVPVLTAIHFARADSPGSFYNLNLRGQAHPHGG